MPELNLPPLKTLNIVASISVEILPYQALFMADPFIFIKSNRCHIFCEVFVSHGDKRVVHLESADTINWLWVSDILTGDDFSFPVVYDAGGKDEVIIVPQISGTKNICAYKYCLTKRTGELLWSIELETETHDLIFLENPTGDKSYLIYGARHHGRAALLASEVRDGPIAGGGAPSVGKASVVAKRGLFEGVMAKILPLRRLTLRPAGNPLDIGGEGFVLPVQATRKGIYGEMLAFLKLNWNLEIKRISYFSPKDLSPAFERFHHFSQVNTDDGWIAVFDIIPNGGGNRWELRVAKLAAE